MDMVYTSEAGRQSILPLPLDVAKIVQISPSETEKQEQLSVINEGYVHHIEERENEVLKVEKDVLAMYEIFTQLHCMVHVQAPGLVAIENQVEVTLEKVTKGVQNIRKASVYQNRLRKRYFGVAVFVIIIILAVILVLLYHFGKL